MKFNDLKLEARIARGINLGMAVRVMFPNGYGASVIRSPYSYGGRDGLYELAVITEDGLCYDTSITSDVEGHLSENDVTELLQKIEALPKREMKDANKHNH